MATELNIPQIIAKEKAWTNPYSALKTYQHIRDSVKYSATELSTEGYVLMALRTSTKQPMKRDIIRQKKIMKR